MSVCQGDLCLAGLPIASPRAILPPIEIFLYAGTTPTMVNLFKFPTSDGYKDLAEEIQGKYKIFGTLILNDGSNAIMDGLECTHNGRALDISRAVLVKWINGEKTPVTWNQFLSTLQNSGLSTLATLVESGLTE